MSTPRLALLAAAALAVAAPPATAAPDACQAPECLVQFVGAGPSPAAVHAHLRAIGALPADRSAKPRKHKSKRRASRRARGGR
jgi:hypothetical protein